MTRDKLPKHLICKLVPNPYQYSPGAYRQIHRNGIELRVDISDYIGHYLYFGFYDAAIEKLFALCQSNFSVIDIGSNIGWVALNFAKRSSSGTIIGFEPDPFNYSVCTNNVTLNAGATIKFGSNLSSRADGGGRGQIYGTATVNGTLDLNGQGLTRADTNNWSMGGLSGNGVVTNNGTGSAELGIVAGGTFSGIIQDGTSVTSLYVKGGNFNITNTNTYSGGTTIDGVQVNLGGNGTDRLGSGAITLVNGGYFKNSNSNQTLNNDIVLGTGGGGVEVGWNNKNIRLNGVVSGDGDFHIRNDSSFTRITGNNTYTGDTLIQGSVNTRSNGLGTGVITLDDVDGIAGNTCGFLRISSKKPP